ncbi:unnamed protein product, partial [Mesorhabditis belari]|uniref:DUF255 domain-containing protein n=1 Tax=Mesorhabditis belari TaxID=2138241 RepID=A0AAF3EZP0_9BILA
MLVWPTSPRIAVVSLLRQIVRMTHTNRLANEKSPYLLQHKNNPIDWYPWGQEAFEAARERNVPIFLSVGYSTCHWCHVMEKESFENVHIAKFLNEHFVSIKVDREERPDVDKMYMNFIQATTGGGGWPMSVFLTPSLAPFVGGTYFPPSGSPFRPGFSDLLMTITKAWMDDKESITAQGEQIVRELSKSLLEVKKSSETPMPNEMIESTYQYLLKRFDKKRGGFGGAPKFPKPVDIDFLIYLAAKYRNEDNYNKASEMVDKTLTAMDRGGIHDHIGKGFHRYSVDAEWHVPHFEKMLYDQGQLLATYSEWHQLTGRCGHVVKDIIEYVETNLTHETGGFYSAEDADSYPTEGATHKKEGAFCVWTLTEIEEVLKNWKAGEHSLADVIRMYYGVEENGNVSTDSDPHGELTGQNVLICRQTDAQVAEAFGLNDGELKAAISEAKAFLSSRRSLRPKPHLDSKIVTCWQGLMISGLSKAYIAMKDETILEKAIKNIDFIKKNLVDEKGDLRRAVYTGENSQIEQLAIPSLAFSDDYAFLIQGLLDLYAVTLEPKHLQWAVDLQKRLDDQYWDMENGGYFVGSSASKDGPAMRVIEDNDGAEPCGSSVSLCNLTRLYELTEDSKYKTQAEKIVERFATRLKKYSFSLSKSIAAYQRLSNQESVKIVIVGPIDDPRTKTFIDYIHGIHIINQSVVHLDPKEKDTWLETVCPRYSDYKKSYDKPAVHICKGTSCLKPVISGEELKIELDKLISKVSLDE